MPSLSPQRQTASTPGEQHVVTAGHPGRTAKPRRHQRRPTTATYSTPAAMRDPEARGEEGAPTRGGGSSAAGRPLYRAAVSSRTRRSSTASPWPPRPSTTFPSDKAGRGTLLQIERRGTKPTGTGSTGEGEGRRRGRWRGARPRWRHG
jgi:hypothetical protein